MSLRRRLVNLEVALKPREETVWRGAYEMHYTEG